MIILIISILFSVLVFRRPRFLLSLIYLELLGGTLLFIFSLVFYSSRVSIEALMMLIFTVLVVEGVLALFSFICSLKFSGVDYMGRGVSF